MNIFSLHCMLQHHFSAGDESELARHWYHEAPFWEQALDGYRVSAKIPYPPERLEQLEQSLKTLDYIHRKAICDYYKARSRKRPIAAIKNLIVLMK